MVTTSFNKKIECASDYVGVQIIENCENLKIGNIYIPGNLEQNTRLAFCKIVSVGVDAAAKTGCKINDYVMIDRLATYGHTSPIACLKYDSVICFTNESNNEYYPLKDMLFVDPDEKDDVTNVNGIYVMNYEDKLNLGTIVKSNLETSEKYPFSVGDKVMVTKGADNVQFGEKLIKIYKKDMIICKVEE